MIPPKANGEFVAGMENVLEVYHRPYNPKQPVVCMDEQPVQLIKETRRPIRSRPGQRYRYDYEYERNGTASLFLFTEALGHWRRTSIRQRRTKLDWAQEIKKLLDNDYPEADKVILICDNLNTHKAGSLYEAFPPEQASRYLQRLEIHYTPVHGSWLNIAECELSAMTRQCMKPRVGNITTLKQRTNAWTQNRNNKQTGIDWRFTTDNARIKLKRLYPKIQS